MTTSSTSVPKIQVDGNFRIGDVSGQVAIGDNISQTQIIYNDCIFVLPDGSTIQGKSWSYIQGNRPPTERIFGRQKELKRIDELFNSTSELAITGFRGTGKSTLASMYIDRLEERGDFAGIFWRKMDESVDIAVVIDSFFSVIGKPVQDSGNYKIEDLLNLFYLELNAAPYFLVLDNFEILLDPKTNKPNKTGFSELIEKANGGTGRSRILFTSWECPASERGIRPNCYTIGGLDDKAAIQLLKNHGLTEPDSELKKAVELSGGHPLALILLVQLVIGEEEPLLSILEDNSLWIGEKGEVAENILDKVYNERLNEKEQEFLQFISLYRLPVPLHAIVMAANDPAWTEAGAKKTALILKRKSLVQKTGDHFWVESLINIYAYDKLNNKAERHMCAYQYYLSLPLPEKPMKKEDIQSLLEAHHHACMAEEYDKAVEIVFNHNLGMYLPRWGNYKLLADLLLRVLPKDHFKDKMLLKGSDSPMEDLRKQLGNATIDYYNKLSALRMNGYVLQELGTTYSQMGQFEKAKQYYEESLDIARMLFDEKQEGIALERLGNFYMNVGDVEKGIQYHKQALDKSRKIDDKSLEVSSLGNIGMASMGLGEVEKSIEYCKQALEIARETANRDGEAHILRNLGSIYYDLGRKEAIEWYEKALEISYEMGDLPLANECLGNIGNIYIQRGLPEKGIKYYEKGLKIARQIEDRIEEYKFYGNLGLAHSNLRHFDQAIDYLEQALMKARKIGDRSGEGTLHEKIGLVYSHMGQLENTIDYYEKALAISREIGDQKSMGNRLAKLGDAYHQLGDLKKGIDYLEKAKVIAQEIGDRHNEGSIFGNLGLIYNELGQLEKSILCYRKALVIDREIGDRQGEGADLANLGKAYSQYGLEEDAIQCYEEALTIVNEAGDKLSENMLLGNLGNVYYELGEIEKSIQYHEKAVVISQDIGDRHREGIRLANLGLAYSDLGQVEKANEYYQKALEIGKEIKDPKIINFCEENLKSMRR
jgi:tetratricopeptide (TPR) repeat protein